MPESFDIAARERKRPRTYAGFTHKQFLGVCMAGALVLVKTHAPGPTIVIMAVLIGVVKFVDRQFRSGGFVDWLLHIRNSLLRGGSVHLPSPHDHALRSGDPYLPVRGWQARGPLPKRPGR